MNLFTKTYRADLPWFRLAAISVLRKFKGELNWFVVTEPEEQNALLEILEEVSKFCGRTERFTVVASDALWPESRSMNGYLAQQWIKMNLHRIIWPSERVWNWDSDVIAIREFSEQDFMGASGRPIYFFTPYNSIILGGLKDKPVFDQRIETQKQIFGLPEIPFEWMRCFPICCHLEILRCAAGRKEWRELLRRCQAGDRSVSEFNLYGQFASMFFPDCCEWSNTERRETWQGPWNDPRKITCQSWSYGGIPADLKKFVEGV